MASNIDVSVPTPVRATTKSVRDNFIAAKDEIEALQTENVQQGDRLDVLESGGGVDLTDLEDRVTVNETDIAGLQTENSVQDDRLDVLEAGGGGGSVDLTDLEDRVDVTETDIAALQTDVGQNTTDITGLDGRVGVNETDIAGLTTQVNTNKADIKDNKDNIAVHEDRIDDLEARPIGSGGGGVPEPDAVKKPELADVGLVRETTVIPNPDFDPTDLVDPKPEFLNSGKWRTLTTGDIETDPNSTFAVDPNDPKYDGLDNQLLVNRFFAEEIEGVGSVDISDSPPSDNKEGDLWFDNEEDVMQLAIFHEGSDAWVPVAPPTTIVERVTKGESTQLAIIDQIEESLTKQSQMDTVINNIADAVPNKVDKSGTNQLPDDTDWKIKQNTSEGKNKTLIHSVGGQLGVYNLKEPSESHHAATKAYVDANSGDNSGVPARPPGLKFMVMIQDALPGYFNWWVRSSTNQQHLELNTTDRDGIVWGADIPREDVRYSDDIPFTVWEVVGGGWKMKVTGTISRIDFHPTHTLCYVSSHTALNGGNFVDNSGPYYITIGGII